jgi:hypothetical protein
MYLMAKCLLPGVSLGSSAFAITVGRLTNTERTFFMSHTVECNKIMKQIGPTLMRMKCGIYLRTLQAEKTKTIRWAYMSTKHTHKQAKAAAISKAIQILVGLQWQVVTTGLSNVQVSKDKKVCAIHFKVEDRDVQYAKRTLNKLYHCLQVDGFPLGMKLRFMPLFANIPNTKDQDHLLTMVGFQQRFCRYTGEYVSGDVSNIDGVLPNGISI